MSKKLYDLVVPNGKRIAQDGTEKTNYINIGAVMEGEDGKMYGIISRTFNPAGILNPDGKSAIIVNMYPPREHTDA